VSELLVLPHHEDPGRRGISTRTYIRDFQRAIGAPAYIPQPVIAAIHGPAFGLALDALGRSRRAVGGGGRGVQHQRGGRWTRGGPRNVRAPAEARRNASLLHELALSGRVFGAEEAVAARARVARRGWVARGGGRCCARVCGGVARKSPVAVTGIKRLSRMRWSTRTFFLTSSALGRTCCGFV